MVSLALSGDLHYLDPRTSKPVKTVRGHQKAITAFAVNPAAKRMYTGSYDGRVYVWDTESGVATAVSGTGHTNQASGFALSKSGKIYSIGMDDMVRAVDVATAKFE